MPSGFQQNNDQLSPGYYRVTINMGYFDPTIATWTEYGSGELSQQGRINPNSWDSYATPPSSNNNGFALAQGNLRWQSIVEELGRVADCQILDVEVYSSGDATDANNDVGGIAFTVKYDRDESVFPGYNAIQKYEDESGGFQYNGIRNSNGTVTIDGVVYRTYWSPSDEEYTIENTKDAIKDLVWRGIVRGWYWDHSPDFTYSRSGRVYKETTGEGMQETVSINMPGDSNSWDYWEDISVNELDGSSTTITNTSSGG